VGNLAHPKHRPSSSQVSSSSSSSIYRSAGPEAICWLMRSLRMNLLNVWRDDGVHECMCSTAFIQLLHTVENRKLGQGANGREGRRGA
jgi:hypothetical protein